MGTAKDLNPNEMIDLGGYSMPRGKLHELVDGWYAHEARIQAAERERDQLRKELATSRVTIAELRGERVISEPERGWYHLREDEYYRLAAVEDRVKELEADNYQVAKKTEHPDTTELVPAALNTESASETPEPPPLDGEHGGPLTAIKAYYEDGSEAGLSGGAWRWHTDVAGCIYTSAEIKTDRRGWVFRLNTEADK